MPNPYKAEDSQLLVGTETDQGVSVTPTDVFGKVADDASLPDPEQDWLVQRVIGGGREPFQQEQGIKEYQGGDIPIILQDGHPIAYALGEDTVTGSSTPYTHTLTPKEDGKPPSQTLEAAYFARGTGSSDFVRTFAGCVPNSLDIEMNEDDELTASLSYWAMGVSTGTSPTTGVSVPDVNPWLFADASSKLSLFEPFARFIDFTVSVENNLEEGRYIAPDADHPTSDARDPFEITYGNVDYEITATIAIEDDALYQELTNPTDGGFEAVIEFQRGGSGDLFRITANGCNFSDAPHDIPGESGKVEVEVTIQPTSLEIEIESDDSTAWV